MSRREGNKGDAARGVDSGFCPAVFYARESEWQTWLGSFDGMQEMGCICCKYE